MMKVRYFNVPSSLFSVLAGLCFVGTGLVAYKIMSW